MNASSHSFPSNSPDVMMPDFSREDFSCVTRSLGAERERVRSLSLRSTPCGSLVSFSSLSMMALYALEISLFSGQLITFSNTPNGTTALRGVWIQSGSSFRTATMLVLFAPKVLGDALTSMDASGKQKEVNLAGGGSSSLRFLRPSLSWFMSSPEATSPVSVTVTLFPLIWQDTVLPTSFPRLSNSSGSKQEANRTLRFLALTEMCANTSGASGVITPTTPGGTSSSPESEFARRTVGFE
mmetsp:Transcript_51044/g.159507  ORF Transcript_51044/g.159507 Transcript_51044/m.159507 type:complete len:240 (+) Transcript_51044:670-1389(+)